MADGTQTGFNFPARRAISSLRPGEIVVDFFAGGGGASEALRQALGRDPDVAVNHDPDAIGMHAANHPFTHHLPADVWTVDILGEVAGRQVGWFHASPDCTHFSQAKGGQPRKKATRSLSWVVLKVAGKLAKAGLAPRIISLENVKQIRGWCRLVAKRCPATGRVITLDMVPLLDATTGLPVMRKGKVVMVNRVAEPGERVPVGNQYLVPDKRQLGKTWNRFIALLRALGYLVEHRLLVASDYGAGTSRERLFLIARRDGAPIVWPAPTHGTGDGQLPVVTAADCIDWSVPCPSIFTRDRPLAEATHRRIAKGIQKFVLGSASPFIVGCGGRAAQSPERPVDAPLGVITTKADACVAKPVLAPLLVQAAHGEGRPGGARRWGAGARDVQRPVGAVTASNGHAVAAASVVKIRGNSAGADMQAPLPTITSGAGAARPAGAAHAMGVLTAFLEQANGGYYDGAGNDLRQPAPTICGTGSQQRVVTANMVTLRRNCDARGMDEPVGTVCASAGHHAVVECTLSPEHEAGALRVAAFLMRYHSTGGQHAELTEPLTTVTTKDRLALVTVVIKGQPYVIVDIGLRMLQRQELFRAQGFPADYIIDRTGDGRRLSNSASTKMCGNSVSPPPLAAIARANLDSVATPEAIAA